MKGVVIYYIVYTIIYFAIATGNEYWAVFNMLSILLPLSYCMYLLCSEYVCRREEKLWLYFSIGVTIARCIYSTACPHAPIEWIYDMNKIFAGLITLCLIIKITLRRYLNY